MRKFWILFLFMMSALTGSSQVDSLTRLLDLSLEELMNIQVVTASGYMQSVSEAPATVTVITSEQISSRGYEQLEDALRDIPGIDMIHINGYAPTLIYFRGMYGAENLRALLMIDGVVENNIMGSNDMAGPAYNLHNVERIEIIWGPVSALYGANAFGGVIHIITKKGQDINGVKVQQGFGSFNSRLSTINMGFRKKNWEIAIGGSFFKSDGPVFKNRDPYYSASFVDNAVSANASIRYHWKQSITSLGVRHYSADMGWGTYANSPTVYFDLPSQGFNNSGLIGIVQRDFRGERPGIINPFLRTYYLMHEYKPGSKLNVTARLQYRETGIGDKSYVYITTDGNRMIRARVATLSKRMGAELHANYSPSEKHRLSAGIQFFQDDIEQGSRRTTVDLTTIYLADGHDTVLNVNSQFLPRLKDYRSNFGSYLQYILSTKWLKKTSFTAGLRYDRNSYFGDVFSPRFIVVNQPSKKWILKLQYGKAFRAPGNLEIRQTPPSGNFRLKHEKISTYEINAIFLATKNVRLQVNGFRNELKDVIILGNLSGFTVDKNPGEHTVNGFEAVIDWSTTKNLSGFFNFTYQDAWGRQLITNVAGPIPGIARYKANAGIACNVDQLFNINLSGNYVGNRRAQRTNPHGQVDDYFLTNVVFSTDQFLRHRLAVTLTIHNVFNVKWLDPGFRTADGLLYSTVLEQPGINGLLKFALKL